MKDVTVIYYTSNKENEVFEKKIQQQLLDSIGDTPLISVSQKPIENFGNNICVGVQPFCDASAFRQLLIGLKEATTTFACVAESDCLYPPEYFNFEPPELDKIYRYSNVWILYGWLGRVTKGLFWQKQNTEGAQFCSREHWIKLLEKSLEGVNGWEDIKAPRVYTEGYELFEGEIPMISIKTGNGLRKWTQTGQRKGSNKGITANLTINELPFWGTAESIRERFIYETT